MEKPEYFVYRGFFIPHEWGEGFVPNPKGKFVRAPQA
jgi:hypothetical protein